MRIYELAKELNLRSKDLVELINELGIEVSSHMATLKGDELDLVMAYLKEDKDNSTTNASEEILDEEQVDEVEEIEKTEELENTEIEEEEIDDDSIELPSSMTVLEFSELIGSNINQVIMKLIELGVMASQNEQIDYETAAILAGEFGLETREKACEAEVDDTNFEIILDFEDKEKDLKHRPPVVTVMGHVDHGKTSLLDRIRESHITRGEAGGITQHIGASTVKVNDETIVFLDTPGHEAFTAMRSRGASITDITILVIAADDGVMPQTIEAINHAKAAGVPIIVAVNKMDKPEANIDRVYQELTENQLMPEEWGGDIVTVPVSAKTGQGIDDLLEMVLMIAELEELKANPNRNAIATVIEANLDVGKGPVATVLVQKGTLKFGDIILSGVTSGRIRAMFDDQGKPVKSVGPSMPAQILGLSEVPESGDQLFVVDDERTARDYAESLKDKLKDDKVKASENISLDALFDNLQTGDMKDLNLIIKTDVKGTIDAVTGSLAKLSNEEVKVNFVHTGVGGITESDVLLADTSNAVIIGFNVRPNATASDSAKRMNVDIRTYRVIYEAIADVEKAINGMLTPEFTEEVIGRAEVRQVFKVPNQGNVAGIYMQNGKVTRNATVRLLRNDVIVTESSISSLKRFKDDVKEINTGYEGGLGLDGYDDIKEGDSMEFYVMKEVAR